LSDVGLIEYQVWGWVKMSAKFIGHIHILKGSKLSTWQVISLSIDDEGRCNLSVPQIAKLSGYSTIETRRAIKELDEMGYLSVSKASGKKNSYAPEFTARSGRNPTEKPSKDTPIEKDTPIFNKGKNTFDPYLLSIENPVSTYKELKELIEKKGKYMHTSKGTYEIAKAIYDGLKGNARLTKEHERIIRSILDGIDEGIISSYRWIMEKESTGQTIEAFAEWARLDDMGKFIGKYRKNGGNIKNDWARAFGGNSGNEVLSTMVRL
jgi:hypothetical protein